jgi:glycosyltransferase involved in cell wall biosynthesis
MLLNEDADIIHAHSSLPYFADIAALASVIKNKPLVVTHHNDVIGYGPVTDIMAAVYNNTIWRLVQSKASKIVMTTKAYFEQSTLKHLDKVEIIPNGVDSNIFYPHRTDLKSKFNAKHLILFVGNFWKQSNKGIDILLKAFSKTNNETTKLLLVGSGETIPFYKSLANSLGVLDKSIFLGSVSDSMLSDIYAACDVLVLPTPSKKEGFGLVLAEAMSSAKPVIGTNIGGIPEVIDHMKNGILVQPNNVDSLADAIDYILSNPNVAEEMGANGREKCLEKYNWKNIAQNVLRLYQDL